MAAQAIVSMPTALYRAIEAQALRDEIPVNTLLVTMLAHASIGWLGHKTAPAPLGPKPGEIFDRMYRPRET